MENYESNLDDHSNNGSAKSTVPLTPSLSDQFATLGYQTDDTLRVPSHGDTSTGNPLIFDVVHATSPLTKLTSAVAPHSGSSIPPQVPNPLSSTHAAPSADLLQHLQHLQQMLMQTTQQQAVQQQRLQQLQAVQLQQQQEAAQQQTKESKIEATSPTSTSRGRSGGSSDSKHSTQSIPALASTLHRPTQTPLRDRTATKRPRNEVNSDAAYELGELEDIITKLTGTPFTRSITDPL